MPAFEEVESEVKADFVAEQRAQAKRTAYKVMRARYEVVLPKVPAKQAADSEVPSAAASR